MAWQRLARTGIRAVMAIIRHTLAPDGDHTRAAVRRDVRARAMRARAWLASPTRRPNDLQSVVRTKSVVTD